MDFGSLLNQFQQDVKQVVANNDSSSARRQRSSSQEEEHDESSKRLKKRARHQESLDAGSFPPVKRIYCICPAGVTTGGPEALHQLCDQLNRSSSSSGNIKISAYMLYVRSNGYAVSYASRARKPGAYQRYDAPTAVADDDDRNPLTLDSPDHLLIWPECWTNEMRDYLQSEEGESRSQCAIWWLSVDNNTGRFQEWDSNFTVHLHQSEYARQHLKNHGVKYMWPMTEYISTQPEDVVSLSDRTIDVLYNPLKGMHYTDEILKRSGATMNFQPIGGGVHGRERISPRGVRTLLSRAKVYIDFGPHPGMDRLPREAALAGCVVITNMEGAAQYDEDVPLPARYKVKSFDAQAVHKLLKDVLENFEERTRELDDYRDWIRAQQDSMKVCVTNLLEELVQKRKKQALIPAPENP